MVDLSVILHVDGDGHIIDDNVFSRPQLLSDPRIVDEIIGTAAVVMEPMMDTATKTINHTCAKIAMVKNERTMRILCDAIERDDDEWPVTIFATDSTLGIALDCSPAARLIVMAPSKRNCDFSFRKWELAETLTYAEGTAEESGMDMLIYEPGSILDVSETELDDELERIGAEYDNEIMKPATEKDLLAIDKVMAFLKAGLVVDNSHMEAFDNDYDDEMDMGSIMDSVSKYVSVILGGYVKMSLFKRECDIQGDIIKKLNGLSDTVADNYREMNKSIDSIRFGMSDASRDGNERILEEMETVNLKYNSVNERLDGIQNQVGQVIVETNGKFNWKNFLPLVISVAALILTIINCIWL
jgi:hypothetical protein